MSCLIKLWWDTALKRARTCCVVDRYLSKITENIGYLSCLCRVPWSTTFIWLWFSIFIVMKHVHFHWNWFLSWCHFFKSMLARIRYTCCSWFFIYCCIIFWFKFWGGCSQPSNNHMIHLHNLQFVFWWWAANIFLCSSKKVPAGYHCKLIWKIVT